MILLHRFQEQPKLSNMLPPAIVSLGPAPTTAPSSSSSRLVRPRTHRSSNPNTGNHQRVRWGPQGQIAMQASSSGPDKAEIARLQAVIANMTGRPGQYASTGMPSAPDPYSDVSLLSLARPRPFYWWLHGFNISQDGVTCNIMRANPEYTSYQKMQHPRRHWR